MNGSIPNLCPHCFYKGLGCPDCIDDELLRGFLREAVDRLSYVSGFLRAKSLKYEAAQDSLEAVSVANASFEFALKTDKFLGEYEKKSM